MNPSAQLVFALSLFALTALGACKDAPPSAGNTGTGTDHAGCSGAAPSPPASSSSDCGGTPGGLPVPPPPAPPDIPARPANAAEMAILAPLVVGSKLGDYAVTEVRGVDHQVLEIVCGKGSARIVLTVGLLASGGPSPPASTERYAVFYSLRGAEPEDGERAAKALAAVLETHGTVPPPPGLGPFVPRPVSL